MVNLRESRFATDKLPFDESKLGWSLATKTGRIGDYAELKEDGQVALQLHTKERNGAWVDDSIALSLKWLRSLPPDPYYARAIKALEVALFVLDDRAVNRHGYSGSQDERLTPPDRARLPSQKDWGDVLDSVRPS